MNKYLVRVHTFYIVLIFILFYLHLYFPRHEMINEIIKTKHICDDDLFIRDLYRYNCGKLVPYPKDKTPRINDGAYYVCEDPQFKPKKSNCVVLSFGIADNDQFDESINRDLDCIVHSFDPNDEPQKVRQLRQHEHKYKNSVTIPINKNWIFHRIGITSEEKRAKENEIGWLDSYQNILNYINLNGKIIDIFKFDTEGSEWDVLTEVMSKNPDLLCKYVKQIAIETHPHEKQITLTSGYKIIRNLEVCFRLFRRDHRFMWDEKGEWQLDDYKLPIKRFKDEVDLARILFFAGELYFVNINFL